MYFQKFQHFVTGYQKSKRR